MLENVPAELRALTQWVVWRYEDSENGAKPTKVPYSPRTNHHASTTNPHTWATFDEARSALAHGGYSGVGFVFTANDPYTGIDLDDPHGDATIMQRQLKVYEQFASYAELSPSGKGLHIIIKGHIPQGRRRSAIEVYSQGRFFTVTGQVYRNAPVMECQALLELLWQQMGSGVSASTYDGSAPATMTDDDVIAMALRAVNGEKFRALLSGAWQTIYPSQSEADFAFIDIIAFYTQNREQIERIFLASPLGDRPKAKRKEYLKWMVDKSFDRLLPMINIEGLSEQLAFKFGKGASSNSKTTAFEAVNVGAVPAAPAINDQVEMFSAPAPMAHDLPPGLLGEIAQFIYRQSPRPVSEIALAGAIGIMAGVVGRAFNVSNTGLNQYVMLVAGTGTGKEAMAAGRAKLFNAARTSTPAITTYLGPGEIVSGPALLKHIAKSPCFCTIAGEFGIRLKDMCARNASLAHTTLRRTLLDLYMKSGKNDTLMDTVYSDKANNIAAVRAPALTILGESTQERLFESFDEGLIIEGLLPRFLTIEYSGPRVEYNEAHAAEQPSFALVERISAIAAYCLSQEQQNKTIDVRTNDAAEHMLKDFNRYCDTKINASATDMFKELWTRAHLKVLKLAALIAVGVNPYDPVIEPPHVQWAMNLVTQDANAMIARFQRGDVGAQTTDVKLSRELTRVILDYISRSFKDVLPYIQVEQGAAMHLERVIPYSYINKRLANNAAFRKHPFGATRAMKIALSVAIDSGLLQPVSPKQAMDRYQSTAALFVVREPSQLQ